MGPSGWWENLLCFACSEMSEDNTPRKAKRSWEHIPVRFAGGPWVCKSNKQETHMVFKSDWINPFSSRCRNFSWPAGDSSLLSHVKVKEAPHKTQDKTLYSEKVKSQVFLLTLRPFPWHHMFSKKEKLLQASAFQPSLLFLWFKTDLQNWLHQIYLRVKRHIALDLFL